MAGAGRGGGWLLPAASKGKRRGRGRVVAEAKVVKGGVLLLPHTVMLVLHVKEKIKLQLYLQ